MLCPACRRQLAAAATACAHCGRPLPGADAAFQLLLADGTRIALTEDVTIGRAAGNMLRLDDPTVSRRHAQIRITPTGPLIEDVGSSYGTFAEGRRLSEATHLVDGTTLRLGDIDVRVERRRDEHEAGRTIVVAAGTSVLAAVAATPVASAAAGREFRPRLRSAVAFKRLDAAEGDHRFVLRGPDGAAVRMSTDDAALVELLAHESSLPELLSAAEGRLGPPGRARLALLLADLGERGMLEGTEAGAAPPPRRRMARLFAPRDVVVVDPSRTLERLYAAGAFLLFTRPARVLLAAIAAVGLVAFGYLVVHTYGTPFVVARHIGLGGLVFILGRFLVVALHELAHGLTVTSFGRRVRRAGFKLVLVFPYAFVDTSESWFEPRRVRIAISAAGPGSDLVVAGCASIAALLIGPGNICEVLYQVAFAGYLGAIFNLNPLIERDGYQILVDVLREPGLRRRSRQWFAKKLAGRGDAGPATRGLAIYAVAGVLWSIGTVVFVILMSIRYHAVLSHILHQSGLAWAVLGALWGVLLLPVVAVFAPPVADRLRGDHP